MGVEENKITNKVKKYLDSIGAWHVKFHASMFTKQGVPDVLACYKGKFIGIELKTNKGIVSELQKYQGREIQKSGGKWFVVKPSNFDEFKKEIEKL